MKMKMMVKSINNICPNIRKKLEKSKLETRFFYIIPAKNLLFEVKNWERYLSIFALIVYHIDIETSIECLVIMLFHVSIG